MCCPDLPPSLPFARLSLFNLDPLPVILGDTSDPSAILPFGLDADVLIHESTGLASSERLLLSRGHSSAAMAGAFAQKLRARNLLLNHFSPRALLGDNANSKKDMSLSPSQQYIQEAKKHAPSVQVFCSMDFDRYLLNIPEAGESADDRRAGFAQLFRTINHFRVSRVHRVKPSPQSESGLPDIAKDELSLGLNVSLRMHQYCLENLECLTYFKASESLERLMLAKQQLQGLPQAQEPGPLKEVIDVLEEELSNLRDRVNLTMPPMAESLEEDSTGYLDTLEEDMPEPAVATGNSA
ncbi:hypothetical protein H696_03874 [Fonticula alba]|uniref:Metallo-beta-lactamase domain-containing protein n=1 Tax=Fonticula alba TaxID=691883 RepID=A0A058Z5B7_FONAL|nr:hypothetical protein H696_03874 [Fonticula alba]KCV69445.1 hypothetical protein H696_03874 [Fonticula alba]|eukprot:XP_009496010.1 hypothetical protein H696_03874 [Fonticula alba]